MRFCSSTFIFTFCLLGFAIFTERALLRAEQSPAKMQLDSELAQGLGAQKKNEPLAVYLLTIEPGWDLSMLWSWWGHTAVLVRDQERDMDLVFDYGLFENLRPDFLYRYLKGQPVFLLGVDPLANTLHRSRIQKRTVYAQAFYAKEEKLRAFYQKLAINAQPQNRKYVYHHYYNNCTTKVRDIIDESLFDRALYRKYSQLKRKESIRKRAAAPALGWPPIFVLFNSAVGYSLDTNYNYWQGTFLPVDLMQALERYRLDMLAMPAGQRSKTAGIGQRRVLWQSPLSSHEESFISLLGSWLFFIIFVSLWLFVFYLYPLLYPKKKLSIFLSVAGWWLCYLPLSLIALFLSYIYFGDSSSSFGYQTAGYNFSVHAFNPLLFFLVIVWPFCRKGKRAKLWFSLHRAFLLFLEVGCVLALFLASYVLPLLIIVLCLQRTILIQVKRGAL